MRRPTVLCFASYFLPGHKSGGPVRSLCNLAAWLADDFDFRVVTRNVDLGDPTPYAGREPGRWYSEQGLQVTYLRPPRWSPARIRAVVDAARPDLLYFQSFLDPEITIAPLACRRVGLLPARLPVIVAPRGELSPGALSLKQRKKAAYLAFAGGVGLYRGVTWHATSEEEAASIRRWAGGDAPVRVAPNLPPRQPAAAAPRPSHKQPGLLRLAFLARISPMKNLTGALELLAGVRSQVSLDIFGTQEDAVYWARCDALMRRLPGNIAARYRGVVPPGEVVATLGDYDALLFPTLGENFGHVILEALLAGCPVLISDRTPWRELEQRRAGVAVPLDDAARMRGVIERFAAMGTDEHAAWSAAARAYGLSYCGDTGVARPTREMIVAALRGSRS